MEISTNKTLQRICERFANNPFSSQLTLRIESDAGSSFFYSESGLDVPSFIASSTKTFLSELFLQLQEGQYLSINDPVARYLPETQLRGLNTFGKQDNFEKFTLSHLLRNTSGIPDYYRSKALKMGKDISERTAKDPGWTYEETLSIARSKKAKFAPGTRAEYSFTNYQILSELAEVVLSEPLNRSLDRLIFSKLKLENTYLFSKEDTAKFASVAPLLFRKQSYLGANRMASLRGEGAIVSSTADTMAFLKYFVNKRLGEGHDQQILGETRKLYPGVAYGQGLMEIRVPKSLSGFRKVPLAVGHLGATGHFMVFVPTLGVYVVGTVNQLASPLLSVKFLSEILSTLQTNSKS
jgi:CubicO group peptidase (beta-lactamase class C family)